MSKVIKGGTIVTADREWKSDILIEGEVIKQIGNSCPLQTDCPALRSHVNRKIEQKTIQNDINFI